METGRLIISRTEKFSAEISELSFSFDGYIYNPLDYARNLHENFLKKYVDHPVKTLFLGMNPGPFGMMQTGVPFGEINTVKDYLKITGEVSKPDREHPKRQIVGLDIKRSEISGLRFWGLVKSAYPEADDFFREHTVFNYCPLAFISSVDTAKNITPDNLPLEERNALDEVCRKYLSDVIEILGATVLIGVGKYAEDKLKKVAKNQAVFSIIHPSPGNPQANRGWAEKTAQRLKEAGIWN